MTTYAPSTAVAPTRASGRTVAAAGVASAALGAGWSFYGAHDWAEIAVVTSTLVVVTALVYGLALPRALRRDDQGTAALSFSIPAVLLTMPAFWSGLPLVLGVAGILAGNAGRRAPTGSGKSIVGLALGAVAVLGYLAIFIGDGVIAGHHGFLLD